MAFDGTAVAAVVAELRSKLIGARIAKIQQPEKDELILGLRGEQNHKLLMSANASLPLLYLTESGKEAPLQSPAFCMLLRKYLSGARISDIYQPDFERIVCFRLEHLDELMDPSSKILIIEIMGKHSNIIFCDEDMNILDSIKRVPSSVSSVREVLPGRKYFIPRTADKLNPLTVSRDEFDGRIFSSNRPLFEAIYTNLTGISPVAAQEICFRASADPDENTSQYASDEDIRTHIYGTFRRYMEDISEGRFDCGIIYDHDEPVDFSALRPESLLKSGAVYREYDSPSRMLEEYYASKALITRIRQRSVDLSKVISNARTRAARKLELQTKQLQDTEKRDKYRVYGELLTTYGYNVESGAESVVLNNYYTSEDIRIPLDKDLSAIDNAKNYFSKYSKMKRTFEAVTVQLEQTREEIAHLDSVSHFLEQATSSEELDQLRLELHAAGYGKAGGLNTKGKARPSKALRPWHYVTEDGFHLYVGRNNYQNDDLTFRLASNSDWWFHVKGSAGSHVILKTDGREVPDRLFEIAGGLAAYYSKNRDSDKVEIDYLLRKNVKKPNGAKPGFVVYYTNYSLVAHPSLDGLTLED